MLSPTHLLPSQSTCDLYSLRHLILQRGGLPDVPSWIRPQAWSLLLRLRSSEKRDWGSEADKSRQEYYDLLEDVLPPGGQGEGSSSSSSSSSFAPHPHDPLITQIHLDLVRSRFNAFSFFQSTTPPSASCPLAPLPQGWADHAPHDARQPPDPKRRLARRRAPKRYALLQRLRTLEQQSSRPATAPVPAPAPAPDDDPFNSFVRRKSQEHQRGHDADHDHDHVTPSSSSAAGLAADTPPIFLSPPSPRPHQAAAGAPSDAGDDDEAFHSAGEATPEPDRSGTPVTRGTAKPTAADSGADADAELDKRSNALLRILFLYALLNPSVGYVQGMVEVASVILWTVGSATGLPSSSQAEGEDSHDHDDGAASPAEPPTNPHFEADAFWCFSILMGDLRELWDFEGLDHSRAGLRVQNARIDGASSPSHGRDRSKRTGEVGGMARALRRLGGRLKWADAELWHALRHAGLSPSLPYYAFRWLATLLSTSLPLPSLVRIWDALLCESGGAAGSSSVDAGPAASAAAAPSLSPSVEFLIDVLTALLIAHRGALLHRLAPADDDDDAAGEAFGACMAFLQDLPDVDVGPILELATMLRQRRVAASLTGEDAPPSDDEGDEAGSGRTGVRDRALSALRGWGGTPSPRAPSSGGGGGSWLRSVSGRGPPPGVGVDPDESTDSAAPASPSPSPSLFAKYATALQASDAAAEISKRGTNWTARAMERWGGGGGSPSPSPSSLGPASALEGSRGGTPSPVPRRSASETYAPNGHGHGNGSAPSPANSPLAGLSSRFGSMGNTFRRNFSTSSNPSHSTPSSASSASHPALQWNRDTAPDFPLPDVMGSPEGRTEYAYFRPGSMLFSPASASASANGGRSANVSPLAEGQGHAAAQGSPSPGGGGGGKPARVLEEWRFPSRSMSSSTSSSIGGTPGGSSARGAGPKPLLLAGSARAAARDTAEDEQHARPAPPASKVVRTGPLGGGSSSPYAAARARGATGTGRMSSISTSGGTTAGRGAPGRRSGSTTESFSSSYAGFSSERSRGSGSGGHYSSRSGSDGLAEDVESRRSSLRSRAETLPDTEEGQPHASVGGSPSAEAKQRRGLPSSTSLQAALQTPGAIPALPSLAGRAAGAVGAGAGTGTVGAGAGAAAQGGPPLGGGLVGKTRQGTVPAGAFGGGGASTAGGRGTPSTSSSTSASASRPSVDARIASSSDVPLVPTDGRQVRRRGRPGGEHVRRKSSANSTTSSVLGMSGGAGSRRSTRDRDRESRSTASSKSASMSGSVDVTGSVFGSVRGSTGGAGGGSGPTSPEVGTGPAPPNRTSSSASSLSAARVPDEQEEAGEQEEEEGEEDGAATPAQQRRYELSDGPVPIPREASEDAQGEERQRQKYELTDEVEEPRRYELTDGPPAALERPQDVRDGPDDTAGDANAPPTPTSKGLLPAMIAPSPPSSSSMLPYDAATSPPSDAGTLPAPPAPAPMEPPSSPPPSATTRPSRPASASSSLSSNSRAGARAKVRSKRSFKPQGGIDTAAANSAARKASAGAGWHSPRAAGTAQAQAQGQGSLLLSPLSPSGNSGGFGLGFIDDRERERDEGRMVVSSPMEEGAVMSTHDLMDHLEGSGGGGRGSGEGRAPSHGVNGAAAGKGLNLELDLEDLEFDDGDAHGDAHVRHRSRSDFDNDDGKYDRDPDLDVDDSVSGLDDFAFTRDPSHTSAHAHARTPTQPRSRSSRSSQNGIGGGPHQGRKDRHAHAPSFGVPYSPGTPATPAPATPDEREVEAGYAAHARPVYSPNVAGMASSGIRDHAGGIKF